MQRSFTYKTAFVGLLYFTAFLAYTSLASIYLLLPPLFGLLFWHYMHALDQERFSYFILIVLMLLLYEVDKGYLLFSSLIYFYLIYQLVLPKLHQYVHCRRCLDLIYVLLAYLGYWLFSLLVHQVFWMPLPSIDWHIIYYIVIEFFILGLL